jgi:hypothetical protein
LKLSGTMYPDVRAPKRISDPPTGGLWSANALGFCLGARSNFVFDDIYWKFIDSQYYGELTSIEDRVGL